MNTVVLIGAGNMGFSMLQGWLQNLDKAFRFVVVDPAAAPRISALGNLGAGRVLSVADLNDLPADARPSAVVFATKPDAVCGAIHNATHILLPDTILISVAAGLEITTIREAATIKNPIARVMPNIGALVGKSASAGFATADMTPAQSTLVETLFNALGDFLWLASENDMHVVTAVSGSGPAYFFAMCEAMINAAVDLGLDQEAAVRLVHMTCAGAGGLIEQTPDATSLRQQVTSPNGTTAAGLEALAYENGLQTIVSAAISAAQKRSLEMA